MMDQALKDPIRAFSFNRIKRRERRPLGARCCVGREDTGQKCRSNPILKGMRSGPPDLGGFLTKPLWAVLMPTITSPTSLFTEPKSMKPEGRAEDKNQGKGKEHNLNFAGRDSFGRVVPAEPSSNGRPSHAVTPR